MAIKKMESGKHMGEWQVRVQPRDKLTGKQMSSETKYTKTKKAAEMVEARLWTEYDDGFNFDDANQLFTTAFRKYIDSKYQEGFWEKGTYKDWQYSAKVFEEYLTKVKVKDMTQSKVRQFARSFVQNRKVEVHRDTVIDRRLNHMKSFFESVIGQSVQKNPVPKRALTVFFKRDEKSKKSRKKVLTNEQMNVIRDRIMNDLRTTSEYSWASKLAILVGLETGMRPQEIQGLKWINLVNDDVGNVFKINDAWNQKENRLNGHLKSRIPKEFRLTLPITDPLYEKLIQYKDIQERLLKEKGIENKNNFIFINVTDFRLSNLGYPINQTSMNEMLKKFGEGDDGTEDFQVGLSMYTLRHTVATKLGNISGMSYPWAAYRMGHTLEEFMQTYVHVDPDKDAKMSNIWVRKFDTQKTQD